MKKYLAVILLAFFLFTWTQVSTEPPGSVYTEDVRGALFLHFNPFTINTTARPYDKMLVFNGITTATLKLQTDSGWHVGRGKYWSQDCNAVAVPGDLSIPSALVWPFIKVNREKRLITKFQWIIFFLLIFLLVITKLLPGLTQKVARFTLKL